METQPENELAPQAPEVRPKKKPKALLGEIWFWIAWFFGNKTRPTDWAPFLEFKARIEKPQYFPSRVDRLREIAKDDLTETRKGFGQAIERTEKLSVAVSLAIGWALNLSSQGLIVRNSWFIASITSLIVSLAILQFGRWRITSRQPAPFDTWLARAESIEDPDEWVLYQARQYAIANEQMSHDTSLVHKRLLASTIFLVIGILLFGFMTSTAKTPADVSTLAPQQTSTTNSPKP
jgi:hypothetical protein